MIDKLLDRLNALYKMSDALSERVSELARISEHEAGSFILKEGQTCNDASLVVSGLVRSYYINEDKDITSRFMDEGFIVTSWISYYTRQPGNEFIETVEDTTFVSLSYSNIQSLYKEFPEFNIVGRKQVEYAFFLSEQRTQLLRKHTAEEKYKFFLDNHPTLLQRVPLKHIATYLGMNEETLSRVRSRYHRRDKN
jgi:CRP-like cAMP-binding protein